MDPIYLAIAAVAVLLLGWLLMRKREGAPAPVREPRDEKRIDTVAGWTPQATRVLTNAERKGYETLRSACPAHIVLAQVPLARFIKVPTRNSYAEWLRRVGYLCADFVVCDRNAQLIAVIELRGTTDVDPRADKRNKRLLRVLKGAGVPVYIWAEQALPSVEAARDQILSTSQKASAAAPLMERPAVHRGGGANPLIDPNRDISQDEVIEMREPPSTWFDEFETKPGPGLPPQR